MHWSLIFWFVIKDLGGTSLVICIGLWFSDLSYNFYITKLELSSYFTCYDEPKSKSYLKLLLKYAKVLTLSPLIKLGKYSCTNFRITMVEKTILYFKSHFSSSYMDDRSHIEKIKFGNTRSNPCLDLIIFFACSHFRSTTKNVEDVIG